MHWPSTRCGSSPVKNRRIEWNVGLRCSSTGVPITTTTYRDSDTHAGSVDTSSVRPMTSRSFGSAPFSRNGIRPDRTVATARSLMS